MRSFCWGFGCAATVRSVRCRLLFFFFKQKTAYDIIDDGEFGKPSFVSYVNERLGGFEFDSEAPRQSPWAGSREAKSFPEFYGDGHVAARLNYMVCTAHGRYRVMAVR